MADGSDGAGVSPAAAAVAGGEIWGTLEELLLACAVSRHGTASWDSVAMEVQTRSPLAARPRLTPRSCRLRFHQLHRRFSAGGGEEAEGEAEGEGEVEVEAEAEDLDASAADGWLDELRRLRVDELRREVQRCDLSIGTLQTKVEQMKEERERSLSGEAKPEGVTGGDDDDNLSSEEPGRSCRESNSTDLKRPKHSGDRSVKEDQAAAKQEASGESMAASKESSDVRSSASLCRRRKVGAAATDEEPEESQPLSALLDRLAARFGSVFERLQASQESDAYRGMIRRHVDLEIMRRKLDRSSSACGYPRSEFYRDLLLLCANAAVYLPRHGPEHAAAAADALALVSAQVSSSLREPKQEVVAAVTAAANAAVDPRRGEVGAAADIVGPLIEKTGKPLIFCRKRSSIAKASAAVARKEESGEKGESVEEMEEESDGEKKAVVATIKDKAWGLRTKKSRGPAKNSKPAKAADDAAATKADKKKGQGDGDSSAAGGITKKRNAVDFLKRLNQGSSPSKKRGSPLATRKRSAAAAAAASPEQQKTRRGPGRKETGRGGSKKGAKTSATKRSVGRPLKRGAAPATPPPSKRAKVNRSERSSSSTRRGGRK